jgi:hypothetical protein
MMDDGVGCSISDSARQAHNLKVTGSNPVPKSRELVPEDMLGDVNRAKIVVTNYHAFKLRERIELSSGGRSLLQGRGHFKFSRIICGKLCVAPNSESLSLRASRRGAHRMPPSVRSAAYVAARDLNRRYIGIELDTSYYGNAVHRLAFG